MKTKFGAILVSVGALASQSANAVRSTTRPLREMFRSFSRTDPT